MRIPGLVLVIACLAVPGCATQQEDDSMFKSASNTTGDETSERMRARIHTELAAGYYGLGNIGVALEEVKDALRADPTYSPGKMSQASSTPSSRKMPWPSRATSVL